MERCRVDPGRMIGRTFVSVCVFEFETAIRVRSSWCAVQTHYNGGGGSAFMLVECMERCRVPWTSRKYVCIGVCLTEFEAFICVRYSMRSLSHPDVRCKYTTMTMTVVCLYWLNVWNGFVLLGPGRLAGAFAFKFEAIICV